MKTRRPHPFDLVARVLGERLQGCVPSAELRATIDARSGAEWERIVGYASAQFVLPAFAAALEELNLAGSADKESAEFLGAVHAANVERNEELQSELVAAVKILNRAGIEPVLLKGAIRLVDQLYPDLGWRMLRDLDLLVSRAAIGSAIAACARAGYVRLDGGANEIVRHGGLVQIDLHEELFPTPEHRAVLRAADVIRRSRPVVFRGAALRLPALEHQIVHLIGHCQIKHLGHALGHVTWRNRLEAAAMLRWGAEGIDWNAISARFTAAGYRRPFLSFVLALHDGGMCDLPPAARIDRLTALQRRRIAVQARSAPLAYLGSRAGWWTAAIRRQLLERDGGERKAVKNLKRLISDRGTIANLAREFLERQRHVVHVLPYASLLSVQ